MSSLLCLFDPEDPILPLDLRWTDLPRTALRPRHRLAGPTTTLPVDPLRLAHATLRADIGRDLPLCTLRSRAIGFLLLYGSSLGAHARNLRVALQEYADFVRTSLAARIGQGLALLHLEDQDYAYIAAYQHVVKSSGRSRGSRRPDFVLGHRTSHQTALLEAKASTARNIQPGDVRRKLTDALAQLEEGLRSLPGRIHEAYATLTVLRDMDAKVDSEAYVTHIKGTAKVPATEDDLVLRNNYGRWLLFMGLGNLGRGLLGPFSEPIPTDRVPILSMGGVELAVTPLGVPFAAEPGRDRQSWAGAVRAGAEWPVLVVGLDLGRLRELAEAARKGYGVERVWPSQAGVRRVDGGVLSVFADGSVFGWLRAGTLSAAQGTEI